MIVVEGTLWPVVFVGNVDDSSVVPRDACIVTEALLDMSEGLAVGVVVAGRAEAGMRSQDAALRWLESHEDMVRSRALRLAWVIEDERIRACTNAWLRCMGQTVFAVQSVSFRTVRSALSWLLEAPWPAGSTCEGRRVVRVGPDAHVPTARMAVRLTPRRA